jgi:uncharacterized membrane protein
MIRRIITIILARTNLIRNISTAIVGALIAAGIIDEAGGAEVLAGIIVLLTGLASYLIERTKAAHVAEVQEIIRQDEPIKVDGYLGPKTKSALVRKMRRTK